eukprot:Pgem_evm1s4615
MMITLDFSDDENNIDNESFNTRRFSDEFDMTESNNLLSIQHQAYQKNRPKSAPSVQHNNRNDYNNDNSNNNSDNDNDNDIIDHNNTYNYEYEYHVDNFGTINNCKARPVLAEN